MKRPKSSGPSWMSSLDRYGLSSARVRIQTPILPRTSRRHGPSRDAPRKSIFLTVAKGYPTETLADRADAVNRSCFGSSSVPGVGWHEVLQMVRSLATWDDQLVLIFSRVLAPFGGFDLRRDGSGHLSFVRTRILLLQEKLVASFK